MAFALALLLLADIGPPRAECVSDQGCELTLFNGCCGGGDCCPRVRAAPKGKDERAACRTMKCEPVDCSKLTCDRPPADLSLYTPACVRRRCEAVLKTAECRVAADCRLVEVAAPKPGETCACPVAQAQPVDAGVPAPVRAPCAQCPPPPFTKAVCLEGRCAVDTFTPGSKKR